MLVSTLAFSGSASAATLIGNYPQTNDNSILVLSPSQTVASLGFTLPTSTNYNLDSVVLRLNVSSDDTPLLQIYADSAKTSTNPNGATLQSVTFTKTPFSINPIDNFTFTPTNTFTFLADTRYWLGLSSTAGIFTGRSSLPAITPTGIPGVIFNGSQLSFDGGSSYPFPNNPNFINTFQINATAVATAVPEPTSLPGYITLLGGLLVTRKIVKPRAAKKVDLQ